MSKSKKTVCIVDGANKRGKYCGAGAIIVDEETGEILKEASKYTGEGTNNESEYNALIFGLEIARQFSIEKRQNDILLLSDSKLVIEQITGNFSVKQANLRPLNQLAKETIAKIIDEGFNIEIEQVSREYTLRADELASEEALKGSNSETENKYPFLKKLKKEKK